MANRLANTANATLSNANHWDQATYSQVMISASQTITSAGTTTGAFTAPNLVNAVTAALFYLDTKGTANTITATLQENLGAGFVDTTTTQTLTLANVNIGWLHFRPSITHTFLTTTANRYRWKIAVDTGSCTIALAAVGSTHFQSFDDRHSVPVTGEMIYDIGINEQSPVSLTIDGTTLTGGAAGSGSPTNRTMNGGAVVGNGGTWKYDTTADVQFDLTGWLHVDLGGRIEGASVASPLPANRRIVQRFDMAGAGQAGLSIVNNAEGEVQGAPKSSTTLWKTTYVSGDGGTGTELVTADAVDWQIGDEILVSASSSNATNYNETESRTITAKLDAFTYELSSPLTYTHSTDARIVNAGHNIVFKGITTAKPMGVYLYTQTNPGNVDFDWVRFENIDPTLFFSVVPISFITVGDNVAFDYCIGYHAPSAMFLFSGSSSTTHQGLISYSAVAAAGTPNSGTTGGFLCSGIQNKHFIDCISMQNGANGFVTSNAYSNTFERCVAYSSNVTNTVTNASPWLNTSDGENTFIECEAHANRGSAVKPVTSVRNTYFECLFGSKGENQTTDVAPASNTFNQVLFDSCTFGSATMVGNYLNQTIGSLIRFHRINDIDNNHQWNTVYGYGFAEPTTIRSPGLAVGIVPENATVGFTWAFKIPVGANSRSRLPGYFLKNPALGAGVSTIELYLPGNPVSGGNPDNSHTLDNRTGTTFNDTDEQSVDISAQYSGDIPGAAIGVINVKSTTPGAILWCDDFFNAGNRTVTLDEITGLNLWVDGMPLEVISPSVPSAADNAAATWAYLLEYLGVQGTVGQAFLELLENAEIAAFK